MTAQIKTQPTAGTTYQQLLDQEKVQVPERLRTQHNPPLDDMRLDPRHYTSREYHDQEVAHVWSRTWQLACREEDIPNVGDHLLYDVADLSLIVVRSSESEIKAFFNSCLHRGRRLVTEPGCKSNFRCPYHAWTWNLDGKVYPLQERLRVRRRRGFSATGSPGGLLAGLCLCQSRQGCRPPAGLPGNPAGTLQGLRPGQLLQGHPCPQED